MSLRHILPCLPILLITGCTSNAGDFPSLAKRPIETRGEAEAAAPSAPAPASSVDQASLRRIEAIMARAKGGEADFEGALGPAQKAVESAKGAGFGSEGWINAQMAISALEMTRGPLKTAIADLDEEARSVAESGVSDGPIVIAQARLAAMDARQNTLVEDLINQLSSR